MNERDYRIFREFCDRVRTVFPDAGIWLFGSRGRDAADEDSDFDVCVVLEKVDNGAWGTVSDIAWDVGFANGVVISTVKFERDQFENGPVSISPLVSVIRSEGIPA